MVVMNGCDVRLGGQGWSEAEWTGVFYPRGLKDGDGLAYIRLQRKRKEIVRMDAVQIERDEALDFWADVVRHLATEGVRRVMVAANNHYQGFSPGTVAALQGRLGLPLASPPADHTGGQLPLA